MPGGQQRLPHRVRARRAAGQGGVGHALRNQHQRNADAADQVTRLRLRAACRWCSKKFQANGLRSRGLMPWARSRSPGLRAGRFMRLGSLSGDSTNRVAARRSGQGTCQNLPQQQHQTLVRLESTSGAGPDPGPLSGARARQGRTSCASMMSMRCSTELGSSWSKRAALRSRLLRVKAATHQSRAATPARARGPRCQRPRQEDARRPPGAEKMRRCLAQPDPWIAPGRGGGRTLPH